MAKTDHFDREQIILILSFVRENWGLWAMGSADNRSTASTAIGFHLYLYFHYHL